MKDLSMDQVSHYVYCLFYFQGNILHKTQQALLHSLLTHICNFCKNEKLGMKDEIELGLKARSDLQIDFTKISILFLY